MAHADIDPYRVLGVPPMATNAQINHAYRTLLRALHPDTRTGPNEFPPSVTAADATQLGEVIAAYALLRDRNRHRARHVEPAAHESTTPASSTPASSRQPSDTAPTRTVQVPIRHHADTARPPLWAAPPVVTAFADVNTEPGRGDGTRGYNGSWAHHGRTDATLTLAVMSVSWKLSAHRRS